MIIASLQGTNLTEKNLLSELKLSLRLLPVITDMVNNKLIAVACEELGLTISNGEISQWLTTYRNMNKLANHEQMEVWLNQNRLTDSDIANLAIRSLQYEKLSNHLCDNLLEKEFALRRQEFDKIEYYKIVIPREDVALEILALLRDGANFLSLAHLHSTDKTAKLGGYVGIVDRAALRPEIEAVLYAATPGVAAGPIKSLGSYHVVMLENLFPATLNEKTKASLREKLFLEWLESERRQKSVEISLAI